MKPIVAILAGGLGTRLTEETIIKPKPMVEIGGKPILWHIMKTYAHYGFNEFVIAAGYKGETIHDYFESDPEVTQEDWIVTILNTGLDTQISGRIRRILEHTKDRTFLTYGDGLANINIKDLLWFHKYQGKMATITVVRPPSRFGQVFFDQRDGKTITKVDEKPLQGSYINGGFMVLEPEILTVGDFADDEIFEQVYLPKLAEMGQLNGYIHDGFWQCMDTIRERDILNEMWETGNAKWRVWHD